MASISTEFYLQLCFTYNFVDYRIAEKLYLHQPRQSFFDMDRQKKNSVSLVSFWHKEKKSMQKPNKCNS